MNAPPLVVGLYPRLMLHRRNQDYLYHNALRELYEELGWRFKIIDNHAFCAKAIFCYLVSRQLRKLGKIRAANRVNDYYSYSKAPSSIVDRANLIHTPGPIPRNCAGKIIREGEFYDFEESARDLIPLATIDRVKSFVVRTELSASYFRKLYPEKFHSRLHVIPFYMPYLKNWEKREPIKSKSDCPLSFIFVGNQARRKGLDHFLDLKQFVRARVSAESRFIVVSNFQDGSDFDLSGCEVHQGISGKSVQDLMEQADYFVLPSRQDSHPKVMYEACAAGCAIIYSNIRPLRDIWKGSGFEVDLGNFQYSLRECVSLLDKKSAYAFGVKNRARFLQEFSPSVSLEKYFKLIDNSSIICRDNT